MDQWSKTVADMAGAKNVGPKLPDSEEMLNYLTAGVPIITKKERYLAAQLFKSGQAQFNVDVNNRYGFLDENSQLISDLRPEIGEEEARLADALGALQAKGSFDDALTINSLIGRLSDRAQIYFLLKVQEQGILRSLMRDVALDIEITDYTEVKGRISAGAPVAQVIDDLPVPWQAIRQIPWPQGWQKVNPVEPAFVELEVYTIDGGLLKDSRAILDGEWIVSRKLDIVTPFEGFTNVYRLMEHNSPPTFVGQKVVITSDPSPEWETKFWGKDGYMDQVFRRAARGEDWETYRSEQIHKRRQLFLALSGVLLVAVSILYRVIW